MTINVLKKKVGIQHIKNSPTFLYLKLRCPNHPIAIPSMLFIELALNFFISTMYTLTNVNTYYTIGLKTLKRV